MTEPRDRFSAPTPRRRMVEVRAVREFVRLPLRAPGLLRTPKATGSTCLVLPGYGTSDLVTQPLRTYLRTRGHRALGWGLGINHGDLDVLIPQVIDRVRSLTSEVGTSVAVVGWSLGGVVARETARDHPELITQVLTFGTPLYGPRHTSAAAAYGEDRIRAIEAQIADRYDRPITVPVTAMYSRGDGVVDWRACIDEYTPGVANVEVTSSHMGMGLDADIWELIATELAAVDDTPL